MSLTSVKASLVGMDAEQLRELIISLYKARPAAKEYLDFFANPDVEKLMEKAYAKIDKEMTRTIRGRCRTRVLAIRRTIKEVASLDVGPELVLELMTYASIQITKIRVKHIWVSDAMRASLARLVSDTIILARQEGLLELALPQIEDAINKISQNYTQARLYRQELSAALEAALNKPL